MPSDDSRSSSSSSSSSSYFHHASAFGISAKIDRPTQQTIPTQAAIALSPSGGHATHRIENYSVPGVVSFKSAHVEVGGSLDTARKNDHTHTTYAMSVIEDLNICNVVTADHVVSRSTVYYGPLPPENSAKASTKTLTPRFSIVGSYFDNLKIAGQPIDVKLDHKAFHDSDYGDFVSKINNSNKHVLMASNIDLKKMAASDHNYDIVCDAAKRYGLWHPTEQPLREDQHFWCSAANRPESAQPTAEEASSANQSANKKKKGNRKKDEGNSKKQENPNTYEIANFGGVVCVPRFGVVYLAEVVVYRNHRHLTMIRVRMCSPGSGSIDGGGSGGGGDLPPRP